MNGKKWWHKKFSLDFYTSRTLKFNKKRIIKMYKLEMFCNKKKFVIERVADGFIHSLLNLLEW